MALRTPEADVARGSVSEIHNNLEQSGADATVGTNVVLPGMGFATDAAYLQQGDDLILIGKDGVSFIVRNYFLLDNPPDLVTPEGGRITPSLVQSFTPPEATGQYAQVGQLAQAAEPIGQVKDLTGQAFAVRVDGTRVALSAGDAVFQGDVIETADSGAINMVFVDKTTFALGGDARLALDEMVYNPANQQGSSSFSIMKGVFVFVSGQIAKTDSTKMEVNTPVATIGIRGTKVAGEIRPAGEESKFTVIDGEIAVATQGGSVIMGDRNATTTVTSFNAVPTPPVVLSQSEVNQSYSSVSSVSGGLINSGGQDQGAPAESAPATPGDNGSDGAGEGGAAAPGEGEQAGGDQEAAGEGEVVAEGEGEGEGAVDPQGEGAAEAEGVAGEGEGGETLLARSGAPEGQTPDGEPADGEGNNQEAAAGEGAAGPEGENGEAEGGSEGDARAADDGPAEENQDQENRDGDRQVAGADDPTRDSGGIEGTGGDQGPDGPGDGRDPVDANAVDGIAQTEFTAGGTSFDSGGDLGGLADGFGSLGGSYEGAFGTSRDLIGSADLTGPVDDFLGGGGLVGQEPPPPNDDGGEQTGSEEPPALDGPIDDDRSAEVTAQVITGGNNIDTLIGGSGADVIVGFQGDDTLTGNAGDDTLTGGAGDDVVSGGAGNDFLIAGTGQGFDSYDGGAGTDTLSFSSTFLGVTADTSLGVASGSEIDSDTFTGVEVLVGGAGNDVLNGDPGVNEIFGGAGDDTIDGAGGTDTIHGGAGDDTIGFDASPETIDGGAGVDKIRLFGAGQTANSSNLVSVGSIEEVDLSGVGSNTLSVSSSLVTTMSGTGTLSALGDGDDVVESDSSWNLTGPFTLGTLVFDRFTDGGSTVDTEASVFRSTGTINFNAGAALTHNIVNLGSLTTSDGIYTNNGSIVLGGTGDIDMTGSKTLAGSGTFTNEQSLSLLDDTVAATLDGSIGTLGLEGTVTIDGKLIIGAATVVDGTSAAIVTGSGTLVNQGTQSIDDGSTLSVAELRNEGSLEFATLTSTITSSRIENAVGAVVDFAADTTIDMAPGEVLLNSGLAQISSSVLTFQDGLIANSGTLDVIAATSTLSVTNGEVAIKAGGTVTGAGSLNLSSSNFDIDTGVGFTLGAAGAGPHLEIITGNITGGGTLVNEADIVIDNTSALSVATFTNSNGGTLDHADGTLAVTSVFENQANANLIVDTTISNTEISFANDFSNSGLVKFVGANQGVISIGAGTGTLTNAASGTIQTFDGDNTLNGVLVNSGTVNIDAGSALSVGGAAGATSFTNAGFLDASGTLTLQETTLTHTGTLQIVAGGVVNVVDNSKLDLLVDVTSVAGSTITVGNGTGTGQLSGAGTLFNAGDLALNNGTLSGNLNDSSGAVSFENTANVNNGAFEFNQDTIFNFANAGDKFANFGTIDINGSSTLTVDLGTFENAAAGTINISGGGTVATSSGGIFSDNGTLNFGASPGALTIDGNMLRGDTASVLIELGGLTPGIGGFDQLTVTGELGAGGTLDIVEFGGFDVGVGDSFAIVNAGTITNSFREISGLDVGGGVVLDAVQNSSGVVLTGRAVTHQGTAAGETLSGGAGDDVFVAGGGDDFILGGGGADLMHGGDGDDVFVAPDTGFGRIDGGGGIDTVRFDGGGFDVTGLRGDQLSGVERIDIAGTGNNTLTLDGDFALGATGGINALTGQSNSLLIDGDTDDTVVAQDSWSNTGSVTIGGNGYSVFESDANGVQIFVDADVAVTIA